METEYQVREEGKREAGGWRYICMCMCMYMCMCMCICMSRHLPAGCQKPFRRVIDIRQSNERHYGESEGIKPGSEDDSQHLQRSGGSEIKKKHTHKNKITKQMMYRYKKKHIGNRS